MYLELYSGLFRYAKKNPKHEKRIGGLAKM